MGPLETLDNISIETAYHAASQQRADAEARGEEPESGPQWEVIRRMYEEAERKGQQAGGGFYDYDENNKKVATWAGLKELFAPEGYLDVPYEDVKDRLFKNTEDTVARGTFGSPTFFVGDEIFFGKDRLRDVEDEIEAAKARS